MCLIIPNLYLGDCSAAGDFRLLKERGVTHILVAADDCKPQFPGEFEYLHFRIYDGVHANIYQHIHPSTVFIATALEANGTVLVHCFAGVCRSATLVTAFVMKAMGLRARDALELVRSKRPQVAPNPGFMLQLQGYEDEVFSSEQNAGYTCAYRSFRSCRSRLFSAWILHAHSSPISNTVQETCEFLFLRSAIDCTKVVADQNNLICSHCRVVLGDVNFSGEKCSCGRLVLPSFRLLKSQIRAPDTS